MSQLDISIFYSHLFTLLLSLYIFSHFSVIILSTFYYNYKLRCIEDQFSTLDLEEINKIDTLNKILE